ncbi:unnamed protein product [Rotaria sp. Silwood2]|nr:unnamed protein product [Rotaria sp. Silwood2]
MYRPFARYLISYGAANLTLLATKRFFNDLRKHLGDDNFDRLFPIHPTLEHVNDVLKALAQMREFQFIISSISSGFYMGTNSFINIKQTVNEHWNKIKWILPDDSNEILNDDITCRRRKYFLSKD